MTDAAAHPVRHPRRGLAVPFVLVGLLLAVWTGWWFWLADQVETRLDAQVGALRQDDWDIRYSSARVSGWPFRVRVALPDAVITAPSGHGVIAPQLVAEANAWNPDRWVIIAPDGLTLERLGKGQVAIAGDGIRMSVSQLRARFPDLRAELIRPTFTPRGEAEPFPIASAERVLVNVRPHLTEGRATTDAIDVAFRLIEARGRPGGPVEGATGQGRLSADIEGTVVNASRLTGMDSAGVFAAWTASGGRFTAIKGELSAGDSRARINSTALSAGSDGRLEGQVAVRAEQPMAAISGLARSRSGAVNRMGAAGAAAATAASGDRGVDLVIQFRDGRTWLGPFALAPAPKLF